MTLDVIHERLREYAPRSKEAEEVDSLNLWGAEFFEYHLRKLGEIPGA